MDKQITQPNQLVERLKRDFPDLTNQGSLMLAQIAYGDGLQAAYEVRSDPGQLQTLINEQIQALTSMMLLGGL